MHFLYKINRMKKILFSLIFIIISIIGTFLILEKKVYASPTNGTINSSYIYSWGNIIGWLNWGALPGSVQITDTSVIGYVWSTTYGWLNMSPAGGGVINNCSGNLSGYAWSASLGWINFSGVNINTIGKFTGQASGTISGIINFDCAGCDVRTDWLQCALRTSSTPPTGGGGPMEIYKGPDGGGIPPWLIPSPAIYDTTSTPECSTPYLREFIRLGYPNNSEEVKKLQQFLKNDLGYSNIEISGIYDQISFDAVVKFQETYVPEILSEYGISQGTGNVLKNTRKKINAIKCPAHPLSCPIFKKTFKLGSKNDEEISRIQQLLIYFNFLRKSYIPNQNYDRETEAAVRKYQAVYSREVLDPWLDQDKPTGIWYLLSRKQANRLSGCDVSNDNEYLLYIDKNLLKNAGLKINN